jgi:hypothetical protein
MKIALFLDIISVATCIKGSRRLGFPSRKLLQASFRYRRLAGFSLIGTSTLLHPLTAFNIEAFQQPDRHGRSI